MLKTFHFINGDELLISSRSALLCRPEEATLSLWHHDDGDQLWRTTIVSIVEPGEFPIYT